MNRLSRALMLVGSVGVVLLAQEDRVIELRSADQLVGSILNGEKVRELIGNVYFVQRTTGGGWVNVWCDRGMQYLDRNRIELIGNVRIVRDSITIVAPEGTYDGNAKRMEARGGVRLTRGRLVLTSQRGEYFAEEKRAFFVGRVVLVDSMTTIWSEELTYFEKDGRSVAVKSVHVFEATNATDVYGDTLVHVDSTGYSLVRGNARLVRIDTSSAGVIDTMVVASRILHAYKDNGQKFLAEQRVRVIRSDIAARCGRALMEGKQDKIVLEDAPVVWSADNQVTGDSMTIRTDKRELRSLYVKGKAMAVSRADSIHVDRFHQLTGREMTLFFADRRLERVFVERNAVSLYYLYDEERPNGVNRSSGDRITLTFAEKSTEKIAIGGGVQGVFTPERLVTGKESEFNLDGFRWRTDRPVRTGLYVSER
jgi:lipopolysaccharide export system protein LptA